MTTVVTKSVRCCNIKETTTLHISFAKVISIGNWTNFANVISTGNTSWNLGLYKDDTAIVWLSDSQQLHYCPLQETTDCISSKFWWILLKLDMIYIHNSFGSLVVPRQRYIFTHYKEKKTAFRLCFNLVN